MSDIYSIKQNKDMKHNPIIHQLIYTDKPESLLHIFCKLTQDEKFYINGERIRIAMEERKTRKNSK